MNAATRRSTILEIIKKSSDPISATVLAKRFDVSRQVIVGDIALLRAQGHEITATARGYLLPRSPDALPYTAIIPCIHTPENTRAELYTMVNMGAFVDNVIVEHHIYGEIIGQLNLKNTEDVDAFMARVDSLETKLLSELTDGIHIHTISCVDVNHYNRVCETLDKLGYLYKD